jgi:hypothetical protein
MLRASMLTLPTYHGNYATSQKTLIPGMIFGQLLM